MADTAAPNPDRSRVRLASSMSSIDSYLQLSSPSPSASPSPSPSPSPAPAVAGHELEEPPKRRRPARRSKPVRMFQIMCRSLPVLTVPRCGRLLLPLQPAEKTAPVSASPARLSSSDSFLSHLISPTGGAAGTSSSHRRMTGTLFGYRDGRVALALQDNPRCRPALVVELALQTHALLREIGTTSGARLGLETEKRHVEEEHGTGAGAGEEGGGGDDSWLLEESLWTMFCNGKRVGYAVRREPTEGDVAVLETLWAVSMGGGVLPGRAGADAPNGEMAYMRGCFEHVIGSPDSESLYMLARTAATAPSSPSSSLVCEPIDLLISLGGPI